VPEENACERQALGMEREESTCALDALGVEPEENACVLDAFGRAPEEYARDLDALRVEREEYTEARDHGHRHFVAERSPPSRSAERRRRKRARPSIARPPKPASPRGVELLSPAPAVTQPHPPLEPVEAPASLAASPGRPPSWPVPESGCGVPPPSPAPPPSFVPASPPTGVPHMPGVPPPPQVCGAVHEPQGMALPQLSAPVPQVAPLVHMPFEVQPQTPASLLALQLLGAVQVLPGQHGWPAWPHGTVVTASCAVVA
jgi:hypothetical protein